MIRPEHQFYIRPDLRKAASTKAESTTAESAIRPKQLVRKVSTIIVKVGVVLTFTFIMFSLYFVINGIQFHLLF
jgi:hypothetical protein